MIGLVRNLIQSTRPLFAKAGISDEDLNSGVESIIYGLGRLAMEAGHAEALGATLAEAVNDGQRFPLLYKFHLSVFDVLTKELEPELIPIAEMALEMERLPNLEALRLCLARVACTPGINAPQRALARLLLFEDVRVGVVANSWKDRPELMSLGIGDLEIDRVAEEQMRTLIDNADVLDDPDPIRPFQVLLASSLSRLQELALVAEAAKAVGKITTQIQMENERRGMVEELVMKLGQYDAVLIRNALGPLWRVQRLEVEKIIDLHPLLYHGKKRDALYSHMRRLKRKAKGDPSRLATRRRPALIDLVIEAQGGAK